MQAHNLTIGEIINSEPQTDKERILVEFILSQDNNIKCLQEDIKNLQLLPTFVQIENAFESLITINTLQSKDSLIDETETKLSKLDKLIKEYIKEREAYSGEVDCLVEAFSDLTDW